MAWQALTGVMLAADAVHRVGSLVARDSATHVPSSAGVYAFWWIGSVEKLLQSNRDIVLKGPAGKRVHVRYQDWWPDDAPYPCLYVGKSTNLRNRFSRHLLRGIKASAHPTRQGNEKAPPRTSSCQLRSGIEHIFPHHENPLMIIDECVGFSWFDDFPDNAVAERFFAEDRLVGHLRPWFNIDSER